VAALVKLLEIAVAASLTPPATAFVASLTPLATVLAASSTPFPTVSTTSSAVLPISFAILLSQPIVYSLLLSAVAGLRGRR